MGYRGEDASRTPANWGHQPPRQSSPGTTGQGNAGSWIDGAQGYGNDDYDDYASGGGVGYGYENGDSQGAYPRQELGRGPEAQYGQPDAYGSQAPYGAPSGYDDPAGYGQPADYGYQQPSGPTAGYGQQPGYDQQSYPQSPEPGYGMPSGGQQRYQAANDAAGPRGGYPPRHAGGSGANPSQDAGNDWYGGQPAAASGASFADTGTYALNGRIIDEYGTGPREAMRTPARGYPPAPGQPQGPGQLRGPGQLQGRPQLPPPARPVISGPQAVPGSGSQQYDDYPSYPGYGGEPTADRSGPGPGPGGDYPTAVRNPSGGYPAAGRNPSGGYPAADRNPSGGYPAAGRNPSGGYPSADRNPSGGYPAAGRNPSGGYPAADRGGYADGYGQDASYRETGGRGYDDYSNPAGGYDGAPGGDPRGGYDDYPDNDPYQDRYGEEAGQRGVGKGGRAKGKKGAARERTARPSGQGGRRGRRPLALTALVVVAVVILGVAAYVFVFNPSSASKNANTDSPLPTGSAVPSAQACVAQYGTYCHIEARADDPTPLTIAELFSQPVVNYETGGHVAASFTLATTKLDKTCSNAVIGSALISKLQSGHCSQVLRASYVSANGKIMGTIGVINLLTTNEAHYAGQVVGENDFIAPLAASKGVASKLGQGTGVVEAEFKGHYLILTWDEFVNGTAPSTTAEYNELEQFSGDLVAGTVNVPLSQRMVTGVAPTPAASS